MELHHDQAPREQLRFCYGRISELPPLQLKPLPIVETISCKTERQCKQTLAHVLNHCQAAIQYGRYNT